MDKNTRKKILIFAPRQHTMIGGIETYSRNLLEIIDRNKYDVYEYYYLDNIPNKIVSQNILGENSKYFFDLFYTKYQGNKLSKTEVFAYVKAKRLMKKLDLNQFDLIIAQNYNSFNFNVPTEKIVYVQHFTKSFYTDFSVQNPFLAKIVEKGFSRNFSFRYDFFHKAKNVVLFDEENEKDVNLPHKSFFKIQLPYDKNIRLKNEINLNKSPNIIFAGRLINFQKNIKFLLKSAHYFDYPLNIYGSGSMEKKIKKTKNVIFHGRYKKPDLENIFSNSKVFALTSKFEGFPFVLVEALANGIPIVVRDTFPSAKFLTNQNKNGFLIPSKASPEEYAEKVNYLLNLEPLKYEKYVDNCLAFANQYLKFEIFKAKWNHLIEQLISENEKVVTK